MKDLQLLKGSSHREIRLLDTVAPDWTQIAIAIGLESQFIRDLLKMTNESRACQHLFMNWLDGKYPNVLPPTWASLHQALLDADFPSLADVLQAVLSE